MVEANSQVPNYDYTYLRPPQDVFNIKHSDQYCQHGEGKKSVRKIFYKVKWNEYERGKIREMNEEIKRQNIILPPNWPESETVRMIYNQRGDIPKCIESLKNYVTWLNDTAFHTLDATTLKFLQDGTIYFMGKDKQYRPIIVVNVYKLNLKGEEGDKMMRAICYALRVAQKHCFVPGYVENWILIVEVNNAGILNFPVSAMKKVVSFAQLYFSSNLEKLYIVNPSMTLNAAWNMIKGMMDHETAEKINFTTKKNFIKLQANIDASQLIKKYGGTAPDPTTFWPPVRFTNDPPYKTEAEIEEAKMKEAQAREESQRKQKAEEDKRNNELKISTNHEEKKFELQIDDTRSPSQVEYTQDLVFENDRRNVALYDLSIIIYAHANYLSRENAKLITWLHHKVKVEAQEVNLS